MKRVFAEIERLKTGGPTEKQVADVREAFLRDLETNIKKNGYLLGQISASTSTARSPRALLLVPDFYKKLTAASIQEAAKTYLRHEQLREGHTLPRKIIPRSARSSGSARSARSAP